MTGKLTALSIPEPVTGRGNSLRHRMRSILDLLAARTGLMAYCERRMRRGLTILMYHRVLPVRNCLAYPLQSLVIPVEAFRAQMHWVARHCRVLPVYEALEVLDSRGPFRRPLVAVTFDDGYSDNFELAAPILEEYGLRGTFFVTSGFVEQGEPLWYDRAADAWQRISPADRRMFLDELRRYGGSQPLVNKAVPGVQSWMAGLKQAAPQERMDVLHEAELRYGAGVDSALYRPMTPLQVTELHSRGHEIASHTVTHSMLPQLDDDTLRAELTQSARCLEAWTGESVVGFCYPNGDSGSRVERSVIDAGYRYGCLMRTGLNLPGVRTTRLARLSITMQRTVTIGHEEDILGFRAELCRIREWWR